MEEISVHHLKPLWNEEEEERVIKLELDSSSHKHGSTSMGSSSSTDQASRNEAKDKSRQTVQVKAWKDFHGLIIKLFRQGEGKSKLKPDSQSKGVKDISWHHHKLSEERARLFRLHYAKFHSFDDYRPMGTVIILPFRTTNRENSNWKYLLIKKGTCQISLEKKQRSSRDFYLYTLSNARITMLS